MALVWLAEVGDVFVRLVGPGAATLDRIQSRTGPGQGAASVSTTQPYATPVSGRPSPLSTVENRLERHLGPLRLGTRAGLVERQALPSVRSRIARTLGRGPEAQAAADVALALILLNSDDDEDYDVGYAIFEGLEVERMPVSASF